MTQPVQSYVRLCPRCGSERPLSETLCENLLEQGPCQWPLADEELRVQGATATRAPEAPAEPAPGLRCPNGHVIGEGDQLCFECGASIAEAPASVTSPEPAAPRVVEGWQLLEPLSAADGPWERFLVRDAAQGRQALLTLYAEGAEPDPAVHEVLRKMPRDHIPELLATGRHEGRAYEVFEHIAGGTLASAGFLAAGNPEGLRRMVDELGRALAGFAEVGLRHRDVRPATILLRTREPLDLVVTGFGSARLSDFDLESVAPLGLTRYSAPEAIVGAVSAASDWWSLGMILLEQATAGACFTGVDDRAFHIHVVTRGVDVPAELEPAVRLLLRGLLARDPLKRWSWPQVQAWLAGEPVAVPEDGAGSPAEASGPVLTLGKQGFRQPELFALAAAEARNWEEARNLTLRGAVSTWLEERGVDPKVRAQVRRLASDEALPEDFRHALVLMVLNPALPLTWAGDIVTPAWLLAHPEEGYAIITGGVSHHLEQMGRETWLVRMRTRAEAVRERAGLLKIELDQERLRVALLASSRANLEAERTALRRIYPDTDHIGLSSIVERSRLSDEDLILLVSAAFHQFTPLASLVDQAAELALRTGVPLDRAHAEAWLLRSRRELFAEAEARIANFARCGITRVDEWADSFRVERRMPLERAVILLAVPREAWKEPPKQQYVANLLELFEKRVAGSVQRGPLVRFVIGKTTPRVDLTELGTAHRPSEALLEHVLSRSEAPVSLDPAALADTPAEGRMRKLVNHALTFRRDTGIDGRYLGFPFLISRPARANPASAAARVVPVLLWPVVVELQSGSQVGTLAFDREREEVRLNPALEGLLEAPEFAKWKAAREELLGRPSIRVGDVMDLFGALAAPRGRRLSRLPGKDHKVPAGTRELACSAALFNAEFTGQSLSEDLRQMRRMPPAGTGLEAVLRVSAEPPVSVPLGRVPERDRFLTVESDPSQEEAVLRARTAPGLLVEGPPGTGKSQTIVNIVADAMGRGESILVVCQKQAALRVVEKRLAAEGLRERLFVVVDVNRDREPIIRALREQVEAVRKTEPSHMAAPRQKRSGLAGRIEALEAEVDRHHEALHAVDGVIGMSYRELLGELVGLELSGIPVEVPGLRTRLASLDHERVSRLEEVCGPLAPLWLKSHFEGSPLHVLKEFSPDKGVIKPFLEEFTRFVTVEMERRDLLARLSAFDVDDPTPLSAWLEKYGRMFEVMPSETRTRLAAWFELFRPGRDSAILGAALLESLEKVAETLGRLDERAHDSALFGVLSALPPGSLRTWFDTAARATAEASFWGRLNPGRWQRRRRLRVFLEEHGEEPTEIRMVALREALGLELRLHTVRREVAEVRQALRLEVPEAPSPLRMLRREVEELLSLLRPVQAAANAVLGCPRPAEAEEMVRSGSLEGYRRLHEVFKSALDRYAARTRSRGELAPLSRWFQESWISGCEKSIAQGRATAVMLQKIVQALKTLEDFQSFRVRAKGLEPDALAVFAALRDGERALSALPAATLEEQVRRVIRREALLGWKARAEQARPELLLEQQELESKVRSLAEYDRAMRELNRQLLAADLDRARLGTPVAWDNLTRLRGPRMKRLREILDQGADLGLMHLRPIWLMNPDVASRLLPLKARLFDLVIYDEASQMPVEYAVPTLFRAGRVVISGDEKQMPPTSFFASRIDGDEDEEFDGEELDEAATAAERAAYEDTWNRREVKDCPDLLQLGRGVLPATTLQIHYRSKYRELIGYSNAAFYGTRLSVPARHPEAEVKRVRPIEVLRVEGVYADQTNAEEARRIVELLAQAWSAPPERCPSIGVVTFNRKQADLVEEVLEERAEKDAGFQRAYQRERDRVQDGEDMGFFVKNVENVQGDERDVIMFSTTFGRDRNKAFRRNFGVLGQTGGERRLNVAVTRAREKVILVTSIPVNEVSDMLASSRAPDKPRDYLQAYLDYAQRISAGELELARGTTGRFAAGAGSRREDRSGRDGFTAAVADYIRELGHKAVPEGDGDAFELDFAIVDPRTGLFGIAIECDAPRHELLSRARAREIWRREVLSRAIPKVHRVSSRAWYHHPEEERRRLREAIHAALREEAQS
jgi:primosomal replication protein N''